MARSYIVGVVLASISAVVPRLYGRKPIIAPIATLSATPIASAVRLAFRSLLSPEISASAMPKIGPISGATSIAPMITAALFESSP